MKHEMCSKWKYTYVYKYKQYFLIEQIFGLLTILYYITDLKDFLQ